MTSAIPAIFGGTLTGVCLGPVTATLTIVTEDEAARRERRRGDARQRAEELGRRIAELAKRRGETGV
jgi:hypothetical protein